MNKESDQNMTITGIGFIFLIIALVCLIPVFRNQATWVVHALKVYLTPEWPEVVTRFLVTMVATCLGVWLSIHFNQVAKLRGEQKVYKYEVLALKEEATNNLLSLLKTRSILASNPEATQNTFLTVETSKYFLNNPKLYRFSNPRSAKHLLGYLRVIDYVKYYEQRASTLDDFGKKINQGGHAAIRTNLHQAIMASKQIIEMCSNFNYSPNFLTTTSSQSESADKFDEFLIYFLTVTDSNGKKLNLELRCLPIGKRRIKTTIYHLPTDIFQEDQALKSEVLDADEDMVSAFLNKFLEESKFTTLSLNKINNSFGWNIMFGK